MRRRVAIHDQCPRVLREACRQDAGHDCRQPGIHVMEEVADVLNRESEVPESQFVRMRRARIELRFVRGIPCDGHGIDAG